MKIAILILLSLIILSCTNKSKKISNDSQNSTRDTAVINSPLDKGITSNTLDDTTRNSDGLYIPMSLIKIATGQWKGEPISFPKNKYNISKVIFNYTFKNDASGNLNLKIIVDENKTSQELSLFFHIYPWGIANNRNNVNMLYIVLGKGILTNSTVTNKNTEVSIKSEFLNLIGKSKGFSAEISNINQNAIELKQIKPTGIYPKNLTKVE